MNTDISTSSKTVSLFSPSVIGLLVVLLFLFHPTLAVMTAILVAAINTWNKGEKKFGFYYLLACLALAVLDEFAYPGKLSELTVLAPQLQFTILMGLFIGICAVVLNYVYNVLLLQHATVPAVKKIHWAWVVPLYLVSISLSVMTGKVLVYGSNLIGRCEFPSIYQLYVENDQKRDDILANMLIRRDDLGCKWVVYYESTTDEFQYDWEAEGEIVEGQKYTRNLFGSYPTGQGDQPLTVYHYIRKQDHPVTNEEVQYQGKTESFEATTTLPIKIKISGVIEYHVEKCFIYGGGLRTCVIAFGYKDVVTRIAVTSSHLSDEELQQIVNTVVEKISQRVIGGSAYQIP